MLLTATVVMAKDIKTLVVTTLPQMHCENCENKIKGNLRFEKGVKTIETSIPDQQVTITYDADKTTAENIIRGFEKLGYRATEVKTIYDFTVKDDVGQDVSLSQYKGKLLLIVNTATRCGFTPQYKELEALYEKYREQGFEILDFPCNQFGGQAPGTIQEIHEFCMVNFDIHFPQFDKVEVNGDNESPLFTYLKSQQPGGDIKWNFTKFLVTRDGRVVKRYEPAEKIADIEVDIKSFIGD